MLTMGVGIVKRRDNCNSLPLGRDERLVKRAAVLEAEAGEFSVVEHVDPLDRLNGSDTAGELRLGRDGFAGYRVLGVNEVGRALGRGEDQVLVLGLGIGVAVTLAITAQHDEGVLVSTGSSVEPPDVGRG